MSDNATDRKAGDDAQKQGVKLEQCLLILMELQL